MKRFLSLIFVIVLTVIIVGCGSADFEDDYNIDEKVVITKTISKEEAFEVLRNARTYLESADKYSFEIEAEYEEEQDNEILSLEQKINVAVDISDKTNRLVIFEGEGKQMDIEFDQKMFVKDGFVYVNNKGAGITQKYKESEEVGWKTIELQVLNFIEFGLSGIEAAIDEIEDNDNDVIYGMDKKGNFVIQSSERFSSDDIENFRLVFKDKQLRYICLQENVMDSRGKTEMTINYGKPKFKFPNNLNKYPDRTEE